MPNVTIYSTSWCPFCHRAKHFLDANQVAYTEVDIEENEAAALQVEQWNRGNRTVPTFDIDGNVYTNPSPAQLIELLGL